LLPAPSIYSASPSNPNSPLWQGEIISNLVQIILDSACISTNESLIKRQIHPFAIILSPVCDLQQDFDSRLQAKSEDKVIPNILFCEMMPAGELRDAGHINSGIWGRIKVNKDERYQFLQKVESECDLLGEGLPELCIDFKRYFTLPTDEVYRRLEINEAKRRCFLVSPYLEHLSSRFTYFLGRVGLALDHQSE
jgi:hypothetical protein